MFKFLKNKKGFTLIEVLVVVVIIGILAALAAPRIIGRIDDARKSNDQALARTLTGAIEQWYMDEEADAVGGGASEPSGWSDLESYLDKNTYDKVTATGHPELGEPITGRFGYIIPVLNDGKLVGYVYSDDAPAGD